jgi:hypothetical protein
MRRQSGTTDLRRPPVHGRGRRLPATDGGAHEEADLLLMKQARAFGVESCSTQNRWTSTTRPSPTGTWMVGRFDEQTNRLLDGMSAASEACQA